jgi:ABC-2 type transport system ATP-binding protein
MRCDIAAAILYTPSILFLDEPTIGLDANSNQTLNQEEDVTVILATHDMHDIEALTERVLVVGNGRTLRDSLLEAIPAEVFGERRPIVGFAGELRLTRLGRFVQGALVQARWSSALR